MARVSWRPIIAPDLGDSAIRGQQLAGQALNQAFSGIGSVLGDFEAQRREANLAELYQRQNAFAAGNDVAGYQADLADGDLVGGLKYLRSGDLAAARSFTGELRNARNADTAFDRSQILAGREDTTYNRNEADLATGVLVAREGQRIEAAVRSGQMTQAEGVAAAAELANKTQNAAQIAASYGAVDRGVLEKRGDVQYGDTRQDRGWMVEDREDARKASALIEKYRGLGGTFTDLESSEDWQKATPQQRTLMRQAFGSTANPGAFASEEPTSSHRVMNYQARAAGFDAVPDTVRTLGDASEFAKRVNAAGAKSSAMGTFQITGQTMRDFAPKVFGNDWQSMKWDGESEDKLAKAVFESTKGNPNALAARWVSLSPSEAARVSKMPWSEARRVIASKESSTNLPSLSQNQAAATQTAVTAQTQLGTDRFGWMANLPQAFGDSSSLVSVAERITSQPKGKDAGPASPLAGQDTKKVQNELERIQSEYSKLHKDKKLSPAAAAVILEQSSDPYNGIDAFNLAKRPLTGPFAKTQYAVDRNKVRDALSQIRFDASGNIVGLTDTVERTQGSQAAVANSGVALQQVEALRAQLARQKADDARLRRFDNPATARLEQQYILAQRQLDKVTTQAALNSRTANGR